MPTEGLPCGQQLLAVLLPPEETLGQTPGSLVAQLPGTGLGAVARSRQICRHAVGCHYKLCCGEPGTFMFEECIFPLSTSRKRIPNSQTSQGDTRYTLGSYPSSDSSSFRLRFAQSPFPAAFPHKVEQCFGTSKKPLQSPIFPPFASAAPQAIPQLSGQLFTSAHSQTPRTQSTAHTLTTA